MEQDGYIPLRLEVLNKRTGNVEMVVLEDSQNVLGPDATSATETDIDMINMLLYVKDRYNVSGCAYHEMTKICKGLPRSYKLSSGFQSLTSGGIFVPLQTTHVVSSSHWKRDFGLEFLTST